jgi:hypothetical protein
MSASAIPEFFTHLPCPVCGAVTWGAVLLRVEDTVAVATDAAHWAVCGPRAQESFEERVEDAYLEARGEA